MATNKTNKPGLPRLQVSAATHGGTGRHQGRKPLAPGEQTDRITVRLSRTQREKFDALGGAGWLRKQIETASLPDGNNKT